MAIHAAPDCIDCRVVPPRNDFSDSSTVNGHDSEQGKYSKVTTKMVFFGKMVIRESTYRNTAMDAVLAETSIGITELKKNPSAVIRDAGTQAVVVLHHNKPSAYLVPASTYEALMDVLDDLQLLPVVQQRIAAWQARPEDVIELSRQELERIARTPVRPSLKPSSRTVAKAIKK